MVRASARAVAARAARSASTSSGVDPAPRSVRNTRAVVARSSRRSGLARALGCTLPTTTTTLPPITWSPNLSVGEMFGDHGGQVAAMTAAGPAMITWGWPAITTAIPIRSSSVSASQTATGSLPPSHLLRARRRRPRRRRATRTGGWWLPASERQVGDGDAMGADDAADAGTTQSGRCRDRRHASPGRGAQARDLHGDVAPQQRVHLVPHHPAWRPRPSPATASAAEVGGRWRLPRSTTTWASTGSGSVRNRTGTIDPSRWARAPAVSSAPVRSSATITDPDTAPG